MDLGQVEDKQDDEFEIYKKNRIKIFGLGVGLVFSVFFLRLFYWQVINGEVYNQKASEANTFFLKTEATRGEIFDRFGEPLAVNNSSFKLIIERLLVPEGKENELIVKTVNFIKSLNVEFNNSLPISINDNGSFEFISNKESQKSILFKILKLEKTATATDCIEKLSKKFDCEDFCPREKFAICAVKYPNFKIGIYSKAAPLEITNDIDKKTMIILLELSNKLPGIKFVSSLQRSYPNPTLASHIIGYTGVISSEEYESQKDKYRADEIIGKSGVELAFEDNLKGKEGKHGVSLARDNSVISESRIHEAVPGNSIFLTLSSKLQACANESLKRNVLSAQNSGIKDCTSAAAVVIDLEDFGILAAANYPTYDLQRYIKDIVYHEEVTKDTSSPLLNRALTGCYAPGSIFKPLIASAALEEGVLNTSETYNCNGAYSHYKGYTLHCMGVHGSINLRRALTKSCNVFFAEMGRRLGADRIADYAKKFGLGVKTGVEIPEKEGILATPERSKKLNQPWYVSTPSQVGIGQSDTSLTPIGLAVYTASIAKGKRFESHLLKEVKDYNLQNTIYKHEPKLVNDKLISEENLNEVRNCMFEVTQSGTASDFRNFPIKIGAKTGTAQNNGSDHTTFICFAPFNEPKIAISVVIANGVSGSYSKNVAKDLLKCYFN